jgi:gamma-glutamyltranspeptidase / glutathione hydrolase
LPPYVESGWQFGKNLVVTAAGMVAAKHPLATRAGLAILQRGGNAVDAAVATAFAVGVVEPWASGLGGAGVLIMASPKLPPVVVDYGVRAPIAARPNMYTIDAGYDQETSWWPSVRNSANIHGALSVAVPGVPAGLASALLKFGTMPLADVLRPAIVLARDGFPVHWTTVLHISMDASTLQRYRAAADMFLPGGAPPTISTFASPQVLRQPDLARTLQMIASDGTQAFYQGDVARRIVEEVQRGGGILTMEDLARYRPAVEPALLYRGPEYTVGVAPGPHAGTTLAETFDILDGLHIQACGHNTTDYLHLTIEATHAALTDRFTLLGDGPGWDLLTGSGRAVSHRDRISNGRAAAWSIHPDSTSTTHVCVIDREGMAVSLTQTLLSWFGSRLLVPGTGVVLNNGMMWFNPVGGHPNSIKPGAGPLSNMTPAIVLSKHEPTLAVGASGGRRILDAVLQVIRNNMDFSFDVQGAISAPRIDASDAIVMIDARIPDEITTELRRRGHCVGVVEEQVWPRYFASPVAVVRNLEKGTLSGGVDPYHAAIAAGY